MPVSRSRIVRNRPFFVIRLALLAIVALVAGCALTDQRGDINAPVANAPTPRVGERWTYRGREGFRMPVVWEETHEVMAAGPNGITIKVAVKGPTLDVERQEVLAAPGLVRVGALFDVETRRFATPLERFRFPLAVGETWNQWVDNYNEATRKSGKINRYVQVLGWDKVRTPAGVFDAIRLRVQMRLDDEEFWRYPTTCYYTIWYAPSVGAPVREEKDASYYERGGEFDTGAVIAQHTLLELTSYTPG